MLLTDQDESLLLQAVSSKLNPRGTDLHDALYDGEDDPIPSPLHLAAVGHYLRDPAHTSLCTLNFDTILEKAMLAEGESEVRIGLEVSATTDSPTVYHLHGVCNDDEAIEPIVGYFDYAELIADENAWQYKYLKQALNRGPLLLAGTSYRDPDDQYWLHKILKDAKYPALVAIAREGLGLNCSDFDLIYKVLEEQWEGLGLEVLRVQDFTDIAQIIRELEYMGNTGYTSPQKRAQEIWNAHDEQFSELQTKYSDLLIENTNHVSRVLGVAVAKGTFWLSGGNGSLSRWASIGACYRSSEYLKKVPTGHDSERIAGEALGSEEVKIKSIPSSDEVPDVPRSVLAIPIRVTNGRSPDFVTGVLTFALELESRRITADVHDLVSDLSSTWTKLITQAAYGGSLR